MSRTDSDPIKPYWLPRDAGKEVASCRISPAPFCSSRLFPPFSLSPPAQRISLFDLARHISQMEQLAAKAVFFEKNALGCPAD